MNYSIGIKWYLTTFHRNGLTSNKQMINATNKSKGILQRIIRTLQPFLSHHQNFLQNSQTNTTYLIKKNTQFPLYQYITCIHSSTIPFRYCSFTAR